MSVVHSDSKNDIVLYTKWNDAIFDFFFNPAKAGQSVRLTMDDTALASIASWLDLSEGDFVRSTSNLIRPSATDVFRTFGELNDPNRGVPFTVGLLAAQVLVASRMHTDDDASKANFWLRFNQTLLRSDSKQPPPAHQMLGTFWRELEQRLNVKAGGRFGVLRIPEDPNEAPLQGRVHINYPLSQCLIRQADREDLEMFFRSNARAAECSTSSLVELLSDNDYAFSKAFVSVLSQARALSGMRHELTQAIDEIRTSARRSASISKTSPIPGRRPKVRLKMRKERGELRIVLQRLLSDWEDIATLSADEWRDGWFEDEELAGFWSGADRSVFVSTDDGYVTSSKVPADTTTLRLLFEADNEDLSGQLSAFTWTEVTLGESLDGLRCLEFAIACSENENLTHVLALRADARTTIRILGGLKFERNRYVYGAAPIIRIENANGASVIVSGRMCPTTDSGDIAAGYLPMEPGVIDVECGDAFAQYEIVDLSREADSSDGGCVGYRVSLSPPMMTSVDLTEDRSTGEAIRTLVGADLL